MKWFFVPAGLALLLLFSPARVSAQDDQYLQVYTLIQEADGLKNSQQPAAALTRYLEAQTALLRFQRVYPEWNTKVVNYRLNYLATRITELSAKTPAAGAVRATGASASPSPATSPQPAGIADLENQLNVLKSQVQQMQTDKTMLEAKLKEAISAQPAAVDPRELTKAQDQVRSLQKENDLLKVNLKSRTPGVDAQALEQLKRDLADANRKLALQADSAGALALEKQALQNRLNSLIPAPWNETNIDATRTALDEANRKLKEQVDATTQLAQEKETLLARVKVLTAEAAEAAALRAENDILKKQVVDLKNQPAATPESVRQLAAAQAQIAALQSDKEVLRREKAALESQLKQVSKPASAAATPSAGVPLVVYDTTRVTELELERDELQKKLAAAQKDLEGRNTQAVTARVDELTRQLATLRTRLDVLEAQKVPYNPEELALFKKPEVPLAAPPVAASKSDKKPVRELPPGTVTLVAEAERDFAARRFDQAEEKYLQVLRQDEKNVYTLANLAAIQLEMNRLDEAEKNILQAVAAAPDDAYSLSILGFLRFRQQKYDSALDALGRAAQLDPKNPEIQNYLGLALSQKGLRVPAETALRKAIDLDPNYASAHYNLAVIYVTQKPPATELARLHYRKALAAGIARNAELEKMLEQGAQ